MLFFKTVPSQRLEQLPQLVAGIRNSDPHVQLEATTAFRKLLSIERNPPIQQVRVEIVIIRVKAER